MSGERWPAWVRRALEPSTDELERLQVPAATLAWCAEATDPLDDEVRHLRPVRLVRPSRRWPWVVAGAAALAVAAVALVIPSPPQPEEALLAEAPVGVSLHLEAGETQLVVPAVRMEGLGQVEIERADEDGAVVVVREGAVRFQVDDTHLEVRVGPLRFTSRDADMRVTVVHEAVLLRVERGEVQVQAGPHGWRVVGPDTWSWPQALADLLDHLEPGLVPPGDGTADAEPSGPEGPPLAALAPTSSPTSLTDGAPPAAVSSPAHSAHVDFKAILETIDAGASDPDQLAMLDSFLDLHAGHPLAEEAAVQRLFILARGEFPDSAWQETMAWLIMNKDSPRRRDMLWLSADLARDKLQDCHRALPLYRELEAVADPADRGRAHAWSGLCAVAEGETEEGRMALEEAMEDAPTLEPPVRAAVQAALEGLEMAP